MDLAFANRIDTDLETLMVTDRTPTGNLILDRTLAKIGAREDTTDTRTWIKVLAAEDADYIREQALLRLLQHGILERRDRSFIWAFGRQCDTLDRRERSIGLGRWRTALPRCRARDQAARWQRAATTSQIRATSP